ncbi:hypothetical protein [Spongiactinospora sp. TRM90649]|uniref:hypothetical protein n=1 Tax=Spongiactinospora sp. TRM90649 TaxID=3031114 RepID=UPI0023F82A9B|nr:hypothetical protein [Spongiactinospora sp. TRM90649]MDF5751117.1 hypothetical protein [Spongiactinospora sp. TRM90649]
MQVVERIQYYAMVLLTGPDDRENPSGLARRRVGADGVEVDEALHRDLQWRPTAEIFKWERGDAVGDLIEISPGEAERIMELFRERFGGEGPTGPGDPKGR